MAKMIRIMGYRCERCGHEWVPRDKTREPKVCPNPACKSPYWDRPRQSEITTKSKGNERKRASRTKRAGGSS